MNVASLVENKKNPKIPDITPGDTVKVSARIVEGGKERIQVFQGVIIKVKKGGPNASFTVRHVAFGIGVERTFPFASPLVEKVEIVRHGKVRRAKLYYLRGLSSRQARRKIKRVEKKVEAIGAELLEPEAEEVLEPEEVLGEEGEMIAVAEQEEVVEEPKAEEVVEEPKAEEVVEEPKAEEVVEEPKAKVAEAAGEVEKPVTEEAVAEEPEAAVEPEAETKEVAEASAGPAEEVVEEPVVEEEKTAAETVAEEVTEEPKAEQGEEPVAEETTEEPKPEDEKS